MSAAQEIGWEQAGITPAHRLLALRIARSYMRRLPKNVLLADVEQAALTGLWDGLQKTTRHADLERDPRAVDFYLKCRIRGAILDELRRHDWLPRRARNEARHELRPLRVLFGDDCSEFSRGFNDGRGSGQRWEDQLPDTGENQEDRLLRRTMSAALERAIAALPPREQRIVRLHYMRGVKFLDISRDIGVSEPRISQLHARAIMKLRAALKEEHDRRGVDRGAGDDSSEDPGTGTFERRVPGGGLGGPPAAAADRPVPAGAGGAELYRAPLPRFIGSRCAPRVARAPAAAVDGGVPVSEQAPAAEPAPERAPVPSVLPEEGINLRAEVARYKTWMLDQAMARTGGSVRRAAALIGVSNKGLLMMLQARGYVVERRRRARREQVAGAAQAPAAAPTEPPPPDPPAPPPRDPELARVERLAARIDWEFVAKCQANRICESLIATKLGHRLGVHKWTVEKALKLGPPARSVAP
ncbi:MAG: hypothetical protein RL685_5167 [Pseudomonadota bacterium]|jgi:RNA polymerase sigma factor for flagellar operon FliA